MCVFRSLAAGKVCGVWEDCVLDLARDRTVTVYLCLGEGTEYCLVCAEVQALIILVWAVWHSGRMCSSLRNSLVLLAGEGGPAMTANKGTGRTHTHRLTSG